MNREELLKIANPILFNTEMVQAILEGRKSVTRRVIKFPEGTTGRLPASGATDYIYYLGGIKRPPYQVGDILYVRETWQCLNPYSDREYVYKASCDKDYASDIGKWLPSIHMPKELARIFLKVTDVRVERLQDIRVGDIDREGTPFGMTMAPYEGFSKIWNSTVKKRDLDKYGWEVNPWVWVIEFERIEVE